jgi:hypothetical protein
MQVPVLIEKSPQGTFYAKAWDLVAEGKSPEEAVNALRTMTRGLKDVGRTVETIEFPENFENSTENPWLSIAGDLKNEPLVEDWLDAMRAYRQQVESDPNY